MRSSKITYRYNFKKGDLSKFIKIVKTGSKTEVAEAKKQIEYFWENFYINNRKEGENAFRQFLDEINSFDNICDIDHQAYFISTLKWAIWAIGDDYFENWVDFFLKCIQHSSGKIRQQTIYTASILNIALTLPRKLLILDTDLPTETLRQKQIVDIVKFGLYAYSTEQLIKKYSQPKFNKYKYVSSMPTSEYKSLQKLMTEEILRSGYFDNIYQWFLQFFEGRVQKIHSDHYLTDLKLLLNMIDEDDYSIIDMIIKN